APRRVLFRGATRKNKNRDPRTNSVWCEGFAKPRAPPFAVSGGNVRNSILAAEQALHGELVPSIAPRPGATLQGAPSSSSVSLCRDHSGQGRGCNAQPLFHLSGGRPPMSCYRPSSVATFHVGFRANHVV